MASISSSVSGSPATAARTASAKPTRPLPLRRMPNAFSDRPMVFSMSRNLLFNVRRCVNASRTGSTPRSLDMRTAEPAGWHDVAMPSASAASVLLRCADIAARTCLASRQTAGRPGLTSSGRNQGDSEPASWPTRRSCHKRFTAPSRSLPDPSQRCSPDAPRPARRRRTSI